jgi:hypothetical protein
MNTDLSDYRHPADLDLMNDIMKKDACIRIRNYIYEHDIEKIYSFYDTVSCIEINGDISTEIVAFTAKACEIFGIKTIPKVYIIRDYDLSAEIRGFETPYIVLSSVYLEKLSSEMLFGVIASMIAGIKAEHHKMLFMISVAELFASFIPWGNVILGAMTNSWKRTRYFTYDRAFYLVTGDYKLTLRSILSEELSDSDSKHLHCGEDGDIYSKQAKDFFSGGDIPKGYYKLTEDFPWAPERYSEIVKFNKER